LDFSHGSEHLWELGRALRKDDEVETRGWVEPRLHELRHGKEQKLLKELGALRGPRGPAGETVRKQQNYFASHAGRMNYKEIADRGWPIGSGAVESACRQSQCRLKRPGPDMPKQSGPHNDTCGHLPRAGGGRKGGLN
jgi:hypothetical protein